jgi:hypothetical protein
MAAVVRTNEELQIAMDTAAIVERDGDDAVRRGVADARLRPMN